MNKKLIVIIILFVTVFGVLLTGIFGAETVNIDTVRATKITFTEASGVKDHETDEETKWTAIPALIAGSAYIDLTKWIVLQCAEGETLKYSAKDLQYTLIGGNPDFVQVTKLGEIIFTKVEFAKVRIYDKISGLHIDLNFINDPKDIVIEIDPDEID